MKVLHIASSMAADWGGIERYVSTLANASAPTDEVAVAAPIGSPIARRTRVEKVPIKLTRKFDLRAFVAFRHLFRDRRFDVLVTHFSPDFVVAALAAQGKRVRTRVLTRHVVIPFVPHRTRLYQRLYEGFIGVSGAAAGALVASGIDPSRVRAVQGGCEPLELDPAKPLSLNSAFNVGTFGRLVPEKGVDTVIEARRIAEQPWTLHVFGDGPHRRKLEASAQGGVVFHGYTTDVGNAMTAMDVVVMPSRWSEAFSIAALESLSLGKPLVASCVGGLPELFVNCAPGKLVEPGNARAFADAIDGYASNPASALVDGEIGRRLYESTYTPAHMAQRLRDAYTAFMD